jgi:hypothetical protein
MKQKPTYNKVNWLDLRKHLKLPETDDNNGYIFGFEIVQDDDIIDYEWFKTEQERDEEIWWLTSEEAEKDRIYLNS